METRRRGADGRRRFSADFKREQVARITRQEVTFAALSRELGIDQSVLHRRKQLAERGGEAAVKANEDVVPASDWSCPQYQSTLSHILEPGRASPIQVQLER